MVSKDSYTYSVTTGLWHIYDILCSISFTGGKFRGVETWFMCAKTLTEGVDE